MDLITLSAFDWVILFVYLGFVVRMGFYLNKFAKTTPSARKWTDFKNVMHPDGEPLRVLHR